MGGCTLCNFQSQGRTSQTLPCTKIDAFEIALSFVLQEHRYKDIGDCHVLAKPSEIRLNSEGEYWDEWKFSGSGSGIHTTEWGICQRFRNPSSWLCKKCKNDEYENIALYKAEKGTTIYLSDNNPFSAYGAYTKIEILKNINRRMSGGGYAGNPIEIYGLEEDKTDNSFYKMTFHGVKGYLNREVSNVRVYFNHRKQSYARQVVSWKDISL